MYSLSSVLTFLFLIDLRLSLSLISMKKSLKVHQNPSYYFKMRNENDGRCVTLVNGDLVLNQDCSVGEAVWESSNVSDPSQATNIWLKNFNTQRYLSFATPVIAVPVLSEKDLGDNSRWNFALVHQGNRAFPDDATMANVTYYVIQNVGTQLCLMVDNNVNMRQKKLRDNLHRTYIF